MKALVTGGGGFAGCYLVEELKEAGHNVASVGNGPSPASQTKIYTQIDLADAEAVNKIDLKDIDVVFHLAGLTNVGESFKQPALYIQVNTEIQINLFEAAIKQSSNPKFVIISSGLIYDPKAPQPLKETSPITTNSPYAVSKLDQEHLANYYQTRGFEVIIARAFNHIGPGQAPGFLVPDLAKRIAEAEKSNQGSIAVGNLEAQRDYSDVRDIVRAYRMLAEKGTNGEVYNVCSGKPRSGKEILDVLLAKSTKKLSTKSDPALMRPSDTPTVYGNNEKLVQATGWKPKFALEQTLDDTLSYWRDQIS